MTSHTHPTSRASTFVRLRLASSTLGPSEQRVIQAVLSHPGDVIEWSTAELASEAGVSPATVIRACQNAGFRGFQHLRLELARDVPVPESPSGHVLDRAFSDVADTMSAVVRTIDRNSFDTAATLLNSARRVLFVGSGFSSPPLHDAAMRFTTAGRPVEFPSDVLAQQFTARTLSSDDVCLAVSYSGANTHTLQACHAAVEGGASVIAMTGFHSSPLTRLATVILRTSPVAKPHIVDPLTVRIAQTVLLSALNSARPGSATELHGIRETVAEALSD